MKFSLFVTALLSVQATRLHQKQAPAGGAEVPAEVAAEPAADKENEIKAAV